MLIKLNPDLKLGKTRAALAFLTRFRTVSNRIEAYRAEIHRRQDEIERTESNFGQTKIQFSTDPFFNEDMMIKILQLKEKLEKLQLQAIRIEKTIRAALTRVTDPKNEKLLRLEYLMLLPRRTVRRRLNIETDEEYNRRKLAGAREIGDWLREMKEKRERKE